MRSERTALRVVSGEALVMVIDRRELHRLNAVGARVLELCDGSTTIDGIVGAIVAEFEVDADTARSDVLEFISELDARGVVAFKERLE
jgi:hypothetical protein